MEQMHYSLAGLSIAFLLFVMMFACIAWGQFVGKKYPAKSGLNVTEGAVFALMGLLVAFTFAGSSQRFDQRRSLMIEESNIISTAFLRLDILQPDDRSILKKDFIDYVTSRLAVYQAMPNVDKVDQAELHSSEIQTKLWSDAVNATKKAGSPMAAMLILPSINLMFDVANSRMSYTYLHPPILIFALLLIVAFASAFLAGYGIAGKEESGSLHILAYVVITTLTLYVIIDLEFPRMGIIRESSFDRYMIKLQNDFTTSLIAHPPVK
jgi:hypothetical protein